MSSAIVKRLTGMSDKEIRDYDWPATVNSTQIFLLRGFITLAERERRREELRKQPIPNALRPPGEPGIFIRTMRIFHRQ